jgi:hypothetical protein
MVELESALLRLASSVFTKQENESLFSTMTKGCGDQSLLLKGVDSLSKVTEATTAVADLGDSAGKVVASLLSFGGAAYSTGRRIGALYRDAIELDMVTVLGSLQYQCHLQYGRLPNELEAVGKGGTERQRSVQLTSGRF